MYDERFARQYRYEPPSEFPLTLPFASIVHHLSGPNTCAHTQTSFNQSVGCWCKHPSSHFHFASRLTTRELAHMLDSLVRVSRRVEENHFVSKWRQVRSRHKARNPSPDTRCQSTLESYQAHSPTHRQDTMSQEFSSSTNRC